MRDKNENRIATNPDKTISILAVEDHEMVRYALKTLFEKYPEFKYVGDVADSAGALKIAETEQPDIILLDLTLEDDDGLELLPKLIEVSRNSKVLVLTASYNPDIHVQAIRSGASGVIHKSQSFETLITAIETVCGGDIWVEKKIFARVIDSFRKDIKPQNQNKDQARIDSLSQRELEVIALLVEGLKNKEIAERLFISSTTVRHHLTNIFNKLNVDDRVELIIFAFRHGLAKPPSPPQ